MSKNYIVWTDIEGTGLVSSEESLLEIACIITDSNFKIVDPQGFQRVIYYSEEEVEEFKRTKRPYVVDMHSANGLWESLPHGVPLKQAEQDLLDYIKQYAPEPRQARIGGNSCSYDAAMLRDHMNSVYEHLHYRIVDISTLSYLFEEQRGITHYAKKGTHRAMDDILESIKEAKYLMNSVSMLSVAEDKFS